MLLAMIGIDVLGQPRAEGQDAPQADDHARDAGQDLDGEAQRPRDPAWACARSARRRRRSESGTAMTMAMREEARVPQMMAQAPNWAPSDGPRRWCGRWRRSPLPYGPVAPVEEVPAVDPDGRPGLDGQHRDGEDEGGQRAAARRSRPTLRQALSSLRRAKSSSPPGQRGLAHRPRLRRGGDTPRHAADGGHATEMLRICLTDCATTLVGSGWKSTCDRYERRRALLRVDRPLQHGADVLGRPRRTTGRSTRWRTRS